jgi:Protein of unknwon function (DUF3310)
LVKITSEIKLKKAAMDLINHPPHYTSGASELTRPILYALGITNFNCECIDIVERCSFCFGSAVKYLWRAGQKGDAVEDLKKAMWYLNWMQSVDPDCEEVSLAIELIQILLRPDSDSPSLAPTSYGDIVWINLLEADDYSNTPLVEADILPMIRLAQRIKNGATKTTKPVHQIITRIQTLLRDQGLMAESEFMDRLSASQPEQP